MLRWARERARLEVGALAARFPRLDAWERGDAQPTLKQLEDFAKATHAPVGFLFLRAPPVETLPIPDYRTMAEARVDRPSPDLLDTIYLCQQRQDWYHDFARAAGETTLPFVGSAKVSDSIEDTASAMRATLGFDIEDRRMCPTWSEALRRFIGLADDRGVLVMCSGVVFNNNTRKLAPEEFRGFALVDDLAPLVFINGADTRAAQMFTLAHELAHVWLGASGISDPQVVPTPGTGVAKLRNDEVERWCNGVAAELLVPLASVRTEARPNADLAPEVDRLAQRYKVSTLVILRRLHEAGHLSRERMRDAYQTELARLRSAPTSGGGNFYLTLGARASKRFARALVASTMEGRTSFTEAFRLLGIKRMSSFDELGHSLGMRR